MPPDKLDCPACEKPGGSPIGMISWVCENFHCPVETFRVIDTPPTVDTDTTGDMSEDERP